VIRRSKTKPVSTGLTGFTGCLFFEIMLILFILSKLLLWLAQTAHGGEMRSIEAVGTEDQEGKLA
jgi:hypothetical protein